MVKIILLAAVCSKVGLGTLQQAYDMDELKHGNPATRCDQPAQNSADIQTAKWSQVRSFLLEEDSSGSDFEELSDSDLEAFKSMIPSAQSRPKWPKLTIRMRLGLILIKRPSTGVTWTFVLDVKREG